MEKNDLAVKKNEFTSAQNGFTVEKNGVTVKKNGVTVEKNDFTVEKNDFTVEKNTIASMERAKRVILVFSRNIRDISFEEEPQCTLSQYYKSCNIE